MTKRRLRAELAKAQDALAECQTQRGRVVQCLRVVLRECGDDLFGLHWYGAVDVASSRIAKWRPPLVVVTEPSDVERESWARLAHEWKLTLTDGPSEARATYTGPRP